MNNYFIEYNTNQFTPERDRAIVETFAHSKNIHPSNIGKAIAEVFETLPNPHSSKYNRNDFISDLKYNTFIGYDYIYDADGEDYILIYWQKDTDTITIYPCEY